MNETQRSRMAAVGAEEFHIARHARHRLLSDPYPSKGSTGIRLYAQGGAAKAESLRAWDIMPTNPY